jgi:hypothetical protein
LFLLLLFSTAALLDITTKLDLQQRKLLHKNFYFDPHFDRKAGCHTNDVGQKEVR